MARGDWKNRELDQSELPGGGKALKWETIKPASAAIGTLKEVDRIEVPDTDRPGETRLAWLFRFNEYPEHAFWPNATDLRTCAAVLGAKPVDWEGERIPLVKTEVVHQKTKKLMPALHCPPPGDWQDVLDQFDGRRKPPGASRGPSKKKVTARKTAKKK